MGMSSVSEAGAVNRATVLSGEGSTEVFQKAAVFFCFLLFFYLKGQKSRGGPFYARCGAAK